MFKLKHEVAALLPYCVFPVSFQFCSHRGGLDSAPRLRAGPARLIDQEVATFVVQTRSHLTPLSTPHDTN